MIARVGITVDALDEVTSDPNLSLDLFVRHHKELTRALLQHGSLIFSDEDEVKAMQDWLAELGAISRDAQKAWTEAIKFLKRNRRMRPLDPAVGALRTAQTSETLRAWKGLLDIAVVDSQQLRALGGEDDEMELQDAPSGVNLACASVISSCARFRRLRELAEDGTCAQGERRDDFFDDVIFAPARDSYVIGIADRFLYGNLWRDGRGSALPWLLDRLDRLPATHYREVIVMSEVVPSGKPDRYGNQTSPRDITEAKAQLLQSWRRPANGGITKVTLVGARRSVPHDRHLSFDAGVGINLPAGFDRLSCPLISVPEGMSWTYLWTPKAMTKVGQAETQYRQAATSAETVAYQRP